LVAAQEVAVMVQLDPALRGTRDAIEHCRLEQRTAVQTTIGILDERVTVHARQSVTLRSVQGVMTIEVAAFDAAVGVELDPDITI
jgi:hypothetical protein